jgi:large subunit ribosomal protein L25
MSAKISLSAELRKEHGKRASRRLRRVDNKVLGTVYGSQKDPASIVLEAHKVGKAMENEAFFSSILTLNIGDAAEKVVVKAVQRHPSKPKIMHMDFFRINMKEKLNMHIPLHFIGEDKAPGIVEGGVFSRLITEVEVRCLPSDLPEYIEVDLSNMAMDQYIHLADLKLPAGVELVAFAQGMDESHNQPVVNLHMPHIIEEPVEEAPISPEVEATRVASDAEVAEGDESAKE